VEKFLTEEGICGWMTLLGSHFGFELPQKNKNI
jgi:hypothetical protein